jgi:predicted dehydrogenase
MTDPTNINRRDFLKGVTLTSLGLALGAEEITLPAEAQQAAAQEQPAGAPVKCAVIGLGPQGRDILTALAKLGNGPVVSLCETYTAAAYVKRATDIAPNAPVQTDYRKVLELPDVQAVFVATPSHLHKQIVLDALQAGKHVYCEAPLATDLAEAKEIATAAKAAKPLFQAGLQNRSNKMHGHVRNFLGDMGKIVGARAQYHKKTSWKRGGGTPERERELSWRMYKATSSGLPGEIGIHQFDVVSWYLKALPTAVTGFGSTMVWDQDGIEVPDTVQCVLDYPKGIRMMYDATLGNSFDSGYEALFGSNCAILIRDQRAWMFSETDAPLIGWSVYARKDKIGDETGIALVADATKLINQGKEPGKVGTDVSKTALYHAINAFLTSIRTSVKPAAGPAEGYQATVIAHKAHEATVSGGRIEFQKDWFDV